MTLTDLHKYHENSKKLKVTTSYFFQNWLKTFFCILNNCGDSKQALSSASFNF